MLASYTCFQHVCSQCLCDQCDCHTEKKHIPESADCLLCDGVSGMSAAFKEPPLHHRVDYRVSSPVAHHVVIDAVIGEFAPCTVGVSIQSQTENSAIVSEVSVYGCLCRRRKTLRTTAPRTSVVHWTAIYILSMC